MTGICERTIKSGYTSCLGPLGKLISTITIPKILRSHRFFIPDICHPCHPRRQCKHCQRHKGPRVLALLLELSLKLKRIPLPFGQHVMQFALVTILATRWRYLHGQLMASLVLVAKLATRWHHLHEFQIWPKYGKNTKVPDFFLPDICHPRHPWRQCKTSSQAPRCAS